MVRIVMTALAIGLAGTLATGADVKYPLTGENTKITFVGTKTKGKHEGGFKMMTGTATVKDGDLTTLKIEVEVDTTSLYSDDAKLTTHLKSPDFFNVKDQPKATFKTTKVEKRDKLYVITGDLMMLGKTKSINFAASVTAGDTLNLVAEFPIDRTNWGMNYGAGQIDNKVTLKVIVVAKK